MLPAEDGKKALEYIQTEKFDIAIIDYGLPDISGWEVSKAIKQKNAQIPVVILTGWGLNISEEEKKRKGADYIISKTIRARWTPSRRRYSGSINKKVINHKYPKN